MATGACQVWSWDITYLHSNVHGVFFHLYLMLDIWSRKVVGWCVEDVECTDVASSLVDETVASECMRPRVLHSCPGASIICAPTQWTRAGS